MTDRILAREAQAIKRLKKRATAHGKRFLADLIEIGKRLQRAKARVGHGNWTTWLQKNFRMSADSASNYMRLHDLSATPEFRSLRNLPIEALYLLARTPAEIRMAVAERADAGEAITRGTIVSVRAEGETKRNTARPRARARARQATAATRRELSRAAQCLGTRQR
jgi:hypothetical protein